MRLPVIPQVFRCALEWEAGGAGQHAVNVLHLKAASTSLTPADVFDVMDSNVTQAMWGPVATTCRVARVSITPLDGSSASQAFSTGGFIKWAGENGGQFTPQVAAIIKLQTGLRGKSNRGRIFLPFTGEANVEEGFFTDALVSDTTAAWVAFSNAITAAARSLALGVASYKGAGAWHQAVNIAMERQSATQRRRQSRNR